MTLIDNIIEKIQTWYKGKYIPPPDYDPNSLVVIVSSGHYEQPFLAKILKKIGQFWLKKYEFIIASILAIAGIIVAIIALSK